MKNVKQAGNKTAAKHHSGAGGKKSSLYTQIRTLVVSTQQFAIYERCFMRIYGDSRCKVAKAFKSCNQRI